VPSISTTEIGRRRAVARFVAAFATALLVPSALVLSAEAHADPDPNAPAIDPKAQCESLDVGGVFVTDVQNGVPRSVCQYIVEGYFYYDTFENGTYLGTSVYKDGATRPTQRPDIPEVFGPVSRPMPPFS
jgi:hypothetical protein